MSATPRPTSPSATDDEGGGQLSMPSTPANARRSSRKVTPRKDLSGYVSTDGDNRRSISGVREPRKKPSKKAPANVAGVKRKRTATAPKGSTSQIHEVYFLSYVIKLDVQLSFCLLKLADHT